MAPIIRITFLPILTSLIISCNGQNLSKAELTNSNLPKIVKPKNGFNSGLLDKKGDLWIGTGGGGAYQYDGEQFTSILAHEGRKYDDSLYHNWIPHITEDRKGNIWFTSMSYGGLNRYDGKTFKQFLQKDGLSDDMVRFILEDSEGKIWLGFNGNRKSALTVYDGTSFYIYPVAENPCHKNIRSIIEAKDGNLWLGGQGGICIFDRTNFTEFLDNNGQPFSGITFIVEDANQHIWFGGGNGLWKFDGKELVEVTKH